MSPTEAILCLAIVLRTSVSTAWEADIFVSYLTSTCVGYQKTPQIASKPLYPNRYHSHVVGRLFLAKPTSVPKESLDGEIEGAFLQAAQP